jgi:thioesterase domain-containing protein
MTPENLATYLYDHIPLSKAMQVSVVSISDEKLVLSAPLAPNINHRDTVFGGSASAIAILAAWSLLHTRLLKAGISSRLVIQRNTWNIICRFWVNSPPVPLSKQRPGNGLLPC